jgi:hypothetical protein
MMRGERSKEIGLSASGFCSESNPSPGSKISTPVFGCELFVARRFFRATPEYMQARVVHNLNQPAAATAVRRDGSADERVQSRFDSAIGS